MLRSKKAAQPYKDNQSSCGDRPFSIVDQGIRVDRFTCLVFGRGKRKAPVIPNGPQKFVDRVLDLVCFGQLQAVEDQSKRYQHSALGAFHLLPIKKRSLTTSYDPNRRTTS